MIQGIGNYLENHYIRYVEQQESTFDGVSPCKKRQKHLKILDR